MVKQQPKRRGRRSHTAKCEFCGKEHGDGSPWWNKSKDGWSITFKKDDKSRNSLLTKGWNSHDEAIRLWKEMSLGQVSAGPVVLDSYSSGEDVTVQWLVNHRLDYLKANSSDSHYKNSKNLLKQFCENGFKDVTISELREDGIGSIKQWVALRSWNDTTKDYFYRCLKAMFNFATGNSEDGLGVIESSPIAKLNTGQNRVRGKARLTLFSADQEKVLLTNTDPRGIHPQLSLAFRVLLATGVRPEEFCKLTAADVRRDSAGDRDMYWWINHKNMKKTRNKRRVYLTPEMQKITTEQMKRYPEGELFRNCWGRSWNKNTLIQGFRRATNRPACVALGLNDHAVGRRTNGKQKKEYHYVVYTYRHTFAHRYLTGYYTRPDGTPNVLNYGEVAELMGNSATEVERTYGKLVKATTYLSKLVKHA